MLDCSTRIVVASSGDARIKEHHLFLEGVPLRGRKAKFLGHYPVARAETEVLYPAQRSNVLVLPADALTAPIDLDGACPVGQLFRGDMLVLVGPESVEEADRNRGRRAEPRPAGGDVRQHRDLDSTRNAGHVHSLAYELVLEVVHVRDDFLLRVVHVDVIVETLFDDYVYVFVDGAVQDSTTVLQVVVREVGAAADEANAEGGLGDYHLIALSRHFCWANW